MKEETKENPLYERTVQLYNDLRAYTEAATELNESTKKETFEGLKDKLQNMSEEEIMETAFGTTVVNQMHDVDIANLGMKFRCTYENAKLLDTSTQFPDEVRDTYLATRQQNFYLLNKKGKFEELNKEKVRQAKENFKKWDIETVTKELERQSKT